MANEKSILNAREAAEYLGTHVETLRRLARRGDIPSFKVGTDWRFRKEALNHWFEQQHPYRGPGTVLVVDDDVDLVRALRRIIDRLGCRSLGATDGAEALEMVARDTPDLIFLDLEMPVINGPDFLEKLRPLYPDLPVVIVTGHPESELMTRAYLHGPLMLLPKPAMPIQVERTVRAVLGDRLPVL